MARFDFKRLFKRQTATPAQPKKKKGIIREWVDAIVFAAIVAQVIRTLLFEPYRIPSASMEQSMRVGDFLFVSKFHYGSRMPMAPLSFPFVHNELPLLGVKSYLDWITLGYARLPGLTEVKRNDVVVFNYPAHDQAPVVSNPRLGTISIPSMKENYVKRCIGAAGDTLSIRGGQVFINGSPADNPPGLQQTYHLTTNGTGLNPVMIKKLGFRGMGVENADMGTVPTKPNTFWFNATREQVAHLSQLPNVVKVEPDIMTEGVEDPKLYPHSSNPGQQLRGYGWNKDHFGPVGIPKKGARVKLDSLTLPLYQRCIVAYEGHKLAFRDGIIFIDDKPASEYTFEMDYYFMMGDNRDNSEDSRFWGFVPEDHIVGKPIFTVFSYEGGFRSDRWFKAVE